MFHRQITLDQMDTVSVRGRMVVVQGGPQKPVNK